MNMQITPKKFLAYTLLPQVGRRMRGLMSGFTFIAFFLAQVYRAVGLLPKGHPYLLSANIGRFGITHVVSETGLLLKRNNAPLDQRIVYWVSMAGIVVLAGQFMLLIAGAFVTMAHAASPDWGDILSQPPNWFNSKDPTDDMAFMLLDRVFGLPSSFFGSCVSLNQNCFNTALPANGYYTDSTHTGITPGDYPNAYHYALHSAFQLYSVALLCIAAVILVYFIGAIIAETAESGTPFGQRFNKTWAPLRLVIAFGLLIPVANGLNAAQYITLYAAKFGSGFATNGWNLFIDTAVTGDNTILGNKNTLVAVANPPPITTLLSFMALAGTCKQATEKVSEVAGDKPLIAIKPYLINPNHTDHPYEEEGTGDFNWDYDAALKYSDGGNIVVRFGEFRLDDQGKPAYTTATSNVNPTCGEITVPITNSDKDSSPGAHQVMTNYYTYIGQMWADATTSGDDPLYKTGFAMMNRHVAFTGADINSPIPTTDQIIQRRDQYQESIKDTVTDSTQQQQNSQSFINTATVMKQYGWAAAGLWYNKLAQVNGTLVAAIYNLPVVTHMPQVMENVQKDNQVKNPNTPGPKRFVPHAGNDQVIQNEQDRDDQIALALSGAYDAWSDNFSQQSASNNIVVDLVNAIFGTSGLFDMSKNQQVQINPLAQLVAVGRGILESAKTNLFAAAVTGLGGGLINLMSNSSAGNIGIVISGMAWSIALIGLTIGIVLTYVLPFLPFLYFFFAVGAWVKTIFEAMIGVPLWALAHLRIDGEGLPGSAAIGGYYMILEIFLRPILIIFGMLGGMIIFVAQATILNEIWSLVTSNLVGFDRDSVSSTGDVDATGSIRYLRDAIDQLFFSAVYAVVIYMLGMASFKMVDQVPDYALRWMGQPVRKFQDENGGANHLMTATTGGLGLMRGQFSGSEGISPGNLGKAVGGR